MSEDSVRRPSRGRSNARRPLHDRLSIRPHRPAPGRSCRRYLARQGRRPRATSRARSATREVTRIPATSTHVAPRPISGGRRIRRLEDRGGGSRVWHLGRRDLCRCARPDVARDRRTMGRGATLRRRRTPSECGHRTSHWTTGTDVRATWIVARDRGAGCSRGRPARASKRHRRGLTPRSGLRRTRPWRQYAGHVIRRVRAQCESTCRRTRRRDVEAISPATIASRALAS